MSARAQVICEIEIQKAPQRRLVEHYHVVQALTSNGAYKALRVRILPRRLGRGEHFAHAHPPDSGPERLPHKSHRDPAGDNGAHYPKEAPRPSVVPPIPSWGGR